MAATCGLPQPLKYATSCVVYRRAELDFEYFIVVRTYQLQIMGLQSGAGQSGGGGWVCMDEALDTRCSSSFRCGIATSTLENQIWGKAAAKSLEIT